MKKLVLRLLKKSTKEISISPAPISQTTVCDYEGLNKIYSLDTFLRRLEDIIGLPSRHFEALYKHPIRLMSLRLQHTPIPNPESPNHESKTLLSLKLNALVKGMKHRESFIMPAGVAPEDINHKKDLWRFATFYALLVYNLGPWITHYRTYYKTTVKQFEILNPFGQMPEVGCELKYELSKPGVPESSLMIAPLIFPPSAMGWLLRDPVAFNAAVSTAINPFNQELIGKVVQYAYDLTPNHETSHKTASLEAEKPPGEKPKETLTISTNKKSNDSPPLSAKDHGRNFFLYLQAYLPTALKSGSNDILISDPNTYGFKAPEIFQKFASANGLDWKTVKNGFNKLSIHITEKKGDRSNDLHTISGANGSKTQWLVIPRSLFSIDADNECLDDLVAGFLSWLKAKVEKKELPNRKDHPLCFPVKDSWYLVSPDIFELYSEENTASAAGDLENQLLSRNLHGKNNGSDFFKFPLGNKTIKVIKISDQHLWPATL